MRKFANGFCCELPPLGAPVVPVELVVALLFLLEPHAAASRANPTTSATALRSHVRLCFGVTSGTSRSGHSGLCEARSASGVRILPPAVRAPLGSSDVRKRSWLGAEPHAPAPARAQVVRPRL